MQVICGAPALLAAIWLAAFAALDAALYSSCTATNRQSFTASLALL
jgi:hypothetical protein